MPVITESLDVLVHDDKVLSDEQEFQRMEDLVCQSIDAQNATLLKGTLTLPEAMERAGFRAMMDHWDTSEMKDVKGNTVVRRQTIDRINSIMQTQIANQQPEEPRISIEPIETSEDAPVVLTRRGGRRYRRATETDPRLIVLEPGLVEQMSGEQKAIVVIALSAEQIESRAPIDEDVAEFLTQPQPLKDGTGLQSPVLDSDDVIRVNDKLKADAAQMMFDRQWEDAYGGYYWLENEILSTIFGTQPQLVDWDWDDNHFIVENPHILNIFVDMDKTHIGRTNYFIYDAPTRLAKAKLLWPKQKTLLDKAKTRGEIVNERTTAARLGAKYRNLLWKEDMVVVRYSWQRGWRYKLSAEEAIDAGHVLLTPYSPEEAFAEGLILLDDDLTILVDTGEQTSPEAENWPHRLILPDGTPIDPSSKKWPTRVSVRKMVQLYNTRAKLEDSECEWRDIPWSWNKNTLIPYSMYGFPEPIKIDDLQQLLNRLATHIYHIACMNAYPAEFWPLSLHDAVKKSGIQPHQMPTASIGVPDEEWIRFLAGRAKLGFAIDANPVPDSLINLFDRVYETMDNAAGNLPALQGQLPAAGTSGRAISQLSSNARGPLALRARFSEDALKRTAKLCLIAMLKWTPDKDWDELNGSYPPLVRDMLRDAMRVTKFDLTVSTPGGKGTSEEIRRQEAREDLQLGIIDPKTAREETNRDPDLIEQRMKQQTEDQLNAEIEAALKTQVISSAQEGPGRDNPEGQEAKAETR